MRCVSVLVPACAVPLRCMGGQSVQYTAAVFGHYSLLKEGLELFLCQRYGVRQQFFKKPHALAEPICPVLALLLFLLLDQLLFCFQAGGFLPQISNSNSPLTTSLEILIR